MVCLSPDQLCNAQLARVAQSNPIDRIEANGELVSYAARDASHRAQVHRGAGFDTADHRLTRRGSSSELTLGQTGSGARESHLATELLRDLQATHRCSIHGQAYHAVTAQ